MFKLQSQQLRYHNYCQRNITSTTSNVQHNNIDIITTTVNLPFLVIKKNISIWESRIWAENVRPHELPSEPHCYCKVFQTVPLPGNEFQLRGHLAISTKSDVPSAGTWPYHPLPPTHFNIKKYYTFNLYKLRPINLSKSLYWVFMFF